MAKLLYQGHGSFRLTSGDGAVMYIDPYAGNGYDLPADFILITHRHHDHDRVDLVTQKTGCTIITNDEALTGGKYNTFSLGKIEVEAVEAANKNHDPACCVGFIVTVDGLKLYFSGDTSRTKQMDEFAAKKLDYAFLCTDGYYNMGMEEAAECATVISAKHNVPVHMKPGELFDMELAKTFNAPGRLILEPGIEISL